MAWLPVELWVCRGKVGNLSQKDRQAVRGSSSVLCRRKSWSQWSSRRAHRTALEASRVKPEVVRTELAVAAVPGGRRHGWCSGRRVGRQELRSIKQRKSRREKLNCLVVVWLSV